MAPRWTRGCVLVVVVLAALMLTADWASAQTAVWRNWSSWSPCTQSCAGGVQERHRTCNILEAGASCDGAADDYRFCNFQLCPVDGAWTTWVPWAACSATCGSGLQTRSRRCEGRVGAGVPCTGETRQENTCTSVPCPVNGRWGQWGAYSACSASCGGGVRSRDRQCDSPPPANGGQNCEGEMMMGGSCNLQACADRAAVDGSWGPWSLVTSCSHTCGQGTQTRTRSCSNPLPANGGAPCPDSALEALQCNDGDCPIDGNWATWSNFSACSLTCGTGVKQRFRSCSDPAPLYNGALCATVPLAENVTDVAGQLGLQQVLSADCNTQACQPIDGGWSQWTNMYPCSVTCNTGVQRRMRKCDTPPPQNGGVECAPTEPANTTIDGVVVEYKTFMCNPGVRCPVHGVWGMWAAWSSCDVTCGSGSQSHTRVCSKPMFGGLPCEGTGREVTACQMPVCNTDGGWAAWAAWADCSATCGGGGERTRSRTCTAPPPSGTGVNCTGQNRGAEVCNSDVCPPVAGGWSSWAEWGPCSRQCGGAGVRARLRACTSPAPERGGAPCVGTNMHVGECDSQPCERERLDGSWGLWSPWNVCSAPCGSGTSSRSRVCDSPPPSPDGAPCIQEKDTGPLWFPTQYLALEDELTICNTQGCAVDGAWGAWSPWTACSRTCGGGRQARSKRCDNPPPQLGGRPCPFASPFSNTVTISGKCNGHVCVTVDNVTTAAPLTTTTPAKKFCLETSAHNKLLWARTEVGSNVLLPCPTPSVGTARRTCEAENTWGKVDTTGCKREDLGELDAQVAFAAKALNNVTALTTAVTMARTTCKVDQITVTGTLMTCTGVVIRLLQRGIPGDPRLDAAMVKHLYVMMVDTVNELLDIKLKDLWNSIIVLERDKEVSTLADLPGALLTMVTDMGVYLRATRGRDFRLVRGNVETNVEAVTCLTTDYRYPPKLPTPTPPNKHIRGGWVPPPEPHVTRFAPADAFWKEPACYTPRSRRAVNVSQERMPTKYPVTIIYRTLHLLLPDIDKRPYTAPRMAKSAKYIPVENMHVVNAKVVSARVVGRTGRMNQSVGITIRFYHEKEGRDQICASLDTHKRNVEYDRDACNMTAVTVNYTECDCQGPDFTFVLLMRPGIIRDNVTYTVSEDVFLEYGCYIGVVIHLLAILALLFIGLWKVDRHWVIINFCLATVLYQLFVVIGRRWVNNNDMCYFMSWLVHYATIVSVSWVLALTALCFKQVLRPQPLRAMHRFYYVLICWGIPLFVATISATLRHGYVIRKYFCWLSGVEYTNLAFFIPVSVISVLAVIILGVTFRMNSTSNKLEKLLDESSEQATRRRFVKALFAFVFIVFFTLMFLGVNIGTGFLVGTVAQCLFVVLIFVLLNEDVQDGYTSKRAGVEEFIRLKKEMQEQGPDLETTHHETDPEWARQPGVLRDDLPAASTRPARSLPPINELDSLELAKATRRERHRKKKRGHQPTVERPVYVARLERLSHPAQGPVNPRAAAYAAAPTPREDSEIRAIPKRTRRSKSRQIRVS